jgi:hypothetical protein
MIRVLSTWWEQACIENCCAVAHKSQRIVGLAVRVAKIASALSLLDDHPGGLSILKPRDADRHAAA